VRIPTRDPSPSDDAASLAELTAAVVGLEERIAELTRALHATIRADQSASADMPSQ